MASSRQLGALSTVCLAAIFALGGCSNAQGDDELQADDIRPALRGLPFRHKLWNVEAPTGDDAAFRGVAHGKHGSTLHFSIVLGERLRVIPIPNTRLQNPLIYSAAGFVVNTDSAEGAKFKTQAEWHAAMDMSVAIQERLCKKATGELCPI